MVEKNKTLAVPRIKGYEIEEVIGTGGMSTIYRANQKSLNRTVVIKELSKTCVQEPLLIERFVREARMAAMLSHENIVHIYKYWNRGNSHCIVMEYVDGKDLVYILNRVYTLPPIVSLVIAYEVIRALAYAHSYNIVHRDIKPGNIMLTRRGEVKLMDFGIAQIPSMTSLTLPGTFLGTPAYMSPEQTLGQKVGPHSDHFSLAVVLYEILTGSKPFYEDDEKTIFERIRTADYLPPRQIDSQIPRTISQLVKKCLQPNPKARYPTTQVLSQKIFKILRRRLRGDPRRFLRIYLEQQEIFPTQTAEEISLQGLDEEEAPDLSGFDLVYPDETVKYGWAKIRDFFQPQQIYRLIRNTCIILLSTLTIWVIHNPRFPRQGNRTVIEQEATIALSAKTKSRIRIHAKPWALVYLNGSLITMTPTAEEFLLESGYHRFLFQSPHYQSQEMTIQVHNGESKRIHVDLSQNP